MNLGSFSTYVLHFAGVLIVLVGLSLKPKMKWTGISLAIFGFLLGTSPVWYSALTQPSEEEIYQQWLQQQETYQRQLHEIEAQKAEAESD